jgi:hypothetical protein
LLSKLQAIGSLRKKILVMGDSEKKRKKEKREHTSVFLFVTVILFNLQPSTRNTSSAPTCKVKRPKGVHSLKVNQFNKRNQKNNNKMMNHPCPIIVHQECSKHKPKMELVQKA